MEIDDFQRHIGATFGERDEARGVASSVAWLVEEVGELSQSIRKGTPAQQLHELGDVLAWLCSIANHLGLSMSEAAARYDVGCPVCQASPCTCPF